MSALERRAFTTAGLELRAAGEKRTVSGYASVFNRRYAVGGFQEEIRPGAFRATLQASPEVLFNVNHGEGGSGLPLARTGNRTLKLEERPKGLWFSATLDDRRGDVKDLLAALDRKDIEECSFAFRCEDDSWDKARTLRQVRAVSLERGDVSLVPFGANRAATAELRSVMRAEYRPARPAPVRLQQQDEVVPDKGDFWRMARARRGRSMSRAA